MSTNILCRLCSLSTNRFVNIYEEDGTNRNLSTKMASCLQILVSPKDVLPTTVCLSCCSKLDESYEFYEKSNEVQVLLRKICESVKDTKKKHLNVDDNKTNCILSLKLQYENKDRSDGQCHYIEKVQKGKNSNMMQPEKTCTELETNKKYNVPVTKKIKSLPLMNTNNNDIEDDDTDSLLPLREELDKSKNNSNAYFSDLSLNPQLPTILHGYSWSCTICENVANSHQELREHYTSEHNQSPDFKCTVCEKRYSIYKSFIRHIKLHHSPKKYTCNICKKSFAQSRILRSHATVHTNDRPHVCSTCNKSFKNVRSLKAHSKVHLPDEIKEKFICEFCHKESSTKHTLEIHRKVHTGERNFMCDICGKSFIAKGSLAYHLLCHTEDKNHICSTCNKTFKTARLLSKHVKSLHTTTKPYKCDTCGKQFRERCTLRCHNRIHTGAMPYSCEFCGKCFRFSGILTVHRRQHTGERPYACVECRRDFTNWANYNKHMKRIHHCDTSNPENSRRRAALRSTLKLTDAEVDKAESVATVTIANPDLNCQNPTSQDYASLSQESHTVKRY